MYFIFLEAWKSKGHVRAFSLDCNVRALDGEKEQVCQLGSPSSSTAVNARMEAPPS